MNEVGKVASSVVDGLKSQPMTLALIVINVIFLLLLVWILRAVNEARTADRTERAALVQQLAECRRSP